MKVCYFGAFKPSYARNNFLRRSLEATGCSIVVCNVPAKWPTYRKYPTLAREFIKIRNRCDVILVAEFGQTVVPLAWALGRLTRKPVIFDFVIGLHESSVIEKRRYAPGDFNARKLFGLDKLAGELADLILTGTTPYKEYLIAAFGFPPGKIRLAPLGVNDWIFRPLPARPRADGKLVALYWGSFIPNHGVKVMVAAAAKVPNDCRLLFRFIGEGEDKRQAAEMAARLGLADFEFWPHVPFELLPLHIAQAELVLGNLGDTPQSKKAMANKVLQGLAMRKPVLTGDTPAIRENFEHGEHVWLCPLGDAEALATSLTSLAADAGLRARLAEQGYRRVLERLTPAVVGRRLKAELGQLLTEKGVGPAREWAD